jgi:hypothetical protein
MQISRELLQKLASEGDKEAAKLLAQTAPVNKADGHQPAFIIDERMGYIIACECGSKPAKSAQRASMQHVWHMSHRRGLSLPRIDQYVGRWPDEKE